MGFKCGIVGLPNVGKSTLFNALTNSSKAQAANFPFCTIDPNIGVVPVPDYRLDELVKISNSKKKINTTISFVDIAGLVEGASKGEGLGNKFLSHIREVDAVIHLIRCFDSDDIQNVNPTVDPIRDLEIIETELLLSDIDTLERRKAKLQKQIKAGDQKDKASIDLLEKLIQHCSNGKRAKTYEIEKDFLFFKKSLHLLTDKPILYVGNIGEADLQDENISKHIKHIKTYKKHIKNK